MFTEKNPLIHLTAHVVAYFFGVPWCIIFLSVSGIVVVEEKFTQSFDEDT